MEAVSKVFTIMLAVALCLMFPLYDHFYKADLMTYNYVYNETISFVENVCDQGKVTPQTYNIFLSKLHQTGRFYDVEIEHYAKRVSPLYLDPTDVNTFTGDIFTYYDGYYTPAILEKLFSATSNIPLDDKRRHYKMSRGDKISVTVKSTSRSASEIMRDAFSGRISTGESINIVYGGMVRNEPQ